jgi:hypothetical protein
LTPEVGWSYKPGVAPKVVPRKKRVKMPVARRLSLLNRRDVTRREYNQIVDILNQRGTIIEDLRRELDTQLKRIAQIQSELDVLRGMLRSKDAGR